MKTILVIDDADFIIESTSTLLAFEGYNVLTAKDGAEGIEKINSENPDMILCDISMPEVDGYDVLDHVRSNPSTNTTPFLILTAFTENANMRIGMEKGADDFIIKPFSREELLAAIDAQWMKQKIYEQKAKERLDEIGRNITYALPHEFRTSLNIISGSAKYLNECAEDISKSEIKEMSEDIMSSADKLLKITENFLMFIRLEDITNNPEKKAMLRTYKTDEPSAVISDLADFKANGYKRNEDLVVIDNFEGSRVDISSESLHKIVDEIADNAFKFSEKGTKVTIEISSEDSFLVASVKDEGRGMTKEQIEKIGAYMQFGRAYFEQQGIGLGLVLTKRLVELHDGRFNIFSDKENGTTVEFSLPSDNQIKI